MDLPGSFPFRELDSPNGRSLAVIFYLFSYNRFSLCREKSIDQMRSKKKEPEVIGRLLVGVCGRRDGRAPDLLFLNRMPNRFGALNSLMSTAATVLGHSRCVFHGALMWLADCLDE